MVRRARLCNRKHSVNGGENGRYTAKNAPTSHVLGTWKEESFLSDSLGELALLEWSSNLLDL